MRVFAVVLALALLSVSSHADDLTGRWGVGLDAGWAGRLGSKEVDNIAGNGAALGASVRHGLTPNWRDALNYEYVDLDGKRLEAVTLSLAYIFFPDRLWTPFVELGAGGAKANHIPESQGAQPALAGTAAVGLEYAFRPDWRASARASVVDADHTSTAIGHEMDAAVFGLGLSYWFGGKKAAPAPVPAPAPAPAPKPVVGIDVTPSSSTLASGASLSLSPSVTGADDKGVTWSLAPAVGAVAADGVYTAPASVVQDSTVTVTATSNADSSKSASSLVYLKAPPPAPKKVSISLDVQFEVKSAVVRPEYAGKIAEVAAFLKAHKVPAEIQGYTDDTGSKEYNVVLSQRRADSVRLYMIEKCGVDAASLTAKGYGSDKPIADNASEAGREQNRRVVTTIDAQE